MTYKSIGLVDLNSILYRIFMAKPKDGEMNYPAEATIGELSIIRQKVDHVVVCLDRPPYFRKELFPGYKASRPKNEELNMVKRNVREMLDRDGYSVAQAEGFEADDLLATLALAYYDQCDDIRLITADKDGAQCLNDHVRLFDARTGEVKDVAWCKKTYGVEPSDMVLLQALMGDSSDEYKGIPSWGPKQAAQAILKCKDLDGIRAALANQKKASDETLKPLPAAWAKFEEHQAELDVYLQLARLRTDAPVDAAALLVRKMPALELSDADDSEFIVPPAEEDLAEEAETMAADVISAPPSGFQNSTDTCPDHPLPGGCTKADVAWADFNKRNGTKHAPLAHPDTPENRALAALQAKERAEPGGRWSQDSSGAYYTSPSEDAAAKAKWGPIIGKDPKADEALRKLAFDRLDAAVPGTAQLINQAAAHDAQSSFPPGTAELPHNVQKAADREHFSKESAAYDARAEARRKEEDAPAVVPASQGPQKPKPGALQGIKEEVVAITPFAHPSWAMALQPASAGHAIAIAKQLHQSKLYLKKFDNEYAVAAAILFGREKGLGMLVSLDAIHVIEGKPSCSSQLISALAEEDPNHEYTMIIESTDLVARIEVKHKKHPKPTPWVYTIEQAQDAGLCNPSRSGQPSNYVKRAATMLLKNVKAQAHRSMFPGKTLGLHCFEADPELQDQTP